MTIQALMNDEKTRILVLEDDADYARVLSVLLRYTGEEHFEITNAQSLAQALERLDEQTHDVVLLDLALPDSRGLDTLRELREGFPDTPVVVLTALENHDLAVQAVREGAQDYLYKNEVDSTMLVRALHFGMERHRSLSRFRQLSMTDELTGLLNRRGFFSLAQQHMMIAQRANRHLMLFFADVDHLKGINDRYGHQVGDEALRSMAQLLRKTFRESDVLARIGGDEFCVLAVDAEAGSQPILTRLEKNLAEHNGSDIPIRLSYSMGVAHFDPNSPLNLDDLLEQADKDLYERKRDKKPPD